MTLHCIEIVTEDEQSFFFKRKVRGVANQIGIFVAVKGGGRVHSWRLAIVESTTLTKLRSVFRPRELLVRLCYQAMDVRKLGNSEARMFDSSKIR